jgi:hypothetical protein
MSYKEVIVSVAPSKEEPRAEHTEEFYCNKVIIKKLGKRKKEDSIDYLLTYIPWSDINDTELMALVVHGLEFGTRAETERWNVVCKGLRRTTLIGLITGVVNPNELDPNPVHAERDRLSIVMHNNWKYIHSQIRCNTLCWECPDAKALECILENRELLKGEEK